MVFDAEKLSALGALLIVIASFGCQKAATTGSTPSSEKFGSLREPDQSDQPHTAVLYVHGMGCPQCAYNVDLQLLKVPGVEDVKVDMSSGRVTARLSPDQPPTQEQLAAAIRETGFTLRGIQMPQKN